MTKHWRSLWIKALILLWVCPFSCCAQVLVKRQMTLMGSIFDISIVARDSVQANAAIDRGVDEISRIENLISEWKPETQISQVNKSAGIKPVQVDKEVFDLTKRAIDYSIMTQGAFDISIAAMDKLWRFDGGMTQVPGAETIRKAVEKVGYQHIVLDSANSTIYLAHEGMKIGFGSIGKGYAADKCRQVLQSNGIEGGIVNASGDLSAWGAQPNGKPWKIGINNPFKTRGISKILKMRTGSVATSGSYEKYAEIDGKRYSHIINPKTGYPSTGLTSVTIVGASAEFANALSTSMMVIGIKEGLILMNRFPHYKYFFHTDSGRIIQSKGL